MNLVSLTLFSCKKGTLKTCFGEHDDVENSINYPFLYSVQRGVVFKRVNPWELGELPHLKSEKEGSDALSVFCFTHAMI